VADRLKMITAKEEAEERAKSGKQWKKAVKNPMRMAAMLAAKKVPHPLCCSSCVPRPRRLDDAGVCEQQEREEAFASGSRPNWMMAKKKVRSHIPSPL
jgi:hypothetical protein